MKNKPETTADRPKKFHTGKMHGNRPKGEKMSQEEKEDRARTADTMARTFGGTARTTFAKPQNNQTNNQNSLRNSIDNYMSYNDALLKSRMA
ncbi:MAG: hypothetical protein VW879_11710, partial [Opitutae bacterium]